ncbi:DNA-binding transcriptional LysR family regulator [Streptomyces sp. SAI-135]|uniref:LysR family transcriptional regulator n=2 Tax=unclassified Streptomyces TaxID=2593676 RepID=UPI0024752AB9|nr:MULTISPECIES: LysR family transcriptional regulator [unclassified Streptomyces]MDH6522618.1 DNA-binding transcriptional LysR family regulator [Streptomyces sp. SAI-090]MDH6613764.1 DNA-binding transcriptional LysR family regulator [Streptomyces sp. SAI-135]
MGRDAGSAWHTDDMAEVDIRQLHYLVAVADEGGITRAAERLTMTQPALSRAIATLERAVGVALLVRLPRGSALTPAGAVLADHARAITRHVSDAVRQAREVGGDTPPLRISARGCDLDALDQMIRGYHAADPRLRTEVVMADWRTQLENLRSGVTDLALVSGDFDDRGLDSEVLAVDERVALLPAAHRLAGREVVDRADLLPDAVISFSSSSDTERAYWLDGAPIAAPEVTDVLQLLIQVRLGNGIAFLPREMLRFGPLPSGIRVVQVNGVTPARLRLVWAEQQTSPGVARFVRHATATYTNRALARLPLADSGAAAVGLGLS